MGYMATAKQTTIRLADADLAILDAIQASTGLFSRSDALRFALRKYAELTKLPLPPKPKKR